MRINYSSGWFITLIALVGLSGCCVRPCGDGELCPEAGAPGANSDLAIWDLGVAAGDNNHWYWSDHNIQTDHGLVRTYGEDYSLNKQFRLVTLKHWYYAGEGFWGSYYSYTNDYRAGDLNAGAGGKYIYLEATYRNYGGFAHPITDIVILVGRNALAPLGYERINQDLNEGAGGDYIWLAVSRDPAYGSPVRGIMVHNPSHGTQTYLEYSNMAVYEGVYQEARTPEGGSVDLNKGAGGDYIYLFFAR